MTEEELIAKARKAFPLECIEDYLQHSDGDNLVLAACEAFYMDGSQDDISGDMEAPMGHFYRVDRWIVFTDYQGFRFLETFNTEEQAIEAFQNLDKEYGDWISNDE